MTHGFANKRIFINYIKNKLWLWPLKVCEHMSWRYYDFVNQTIFWGFFQAKMKYKI